MSDSTRERLEQGSAVFRDKQGERVFVEQSKDGWTFAWNDEPGFRVESIDEVLRWLSILCPSVEIRLTG